MVGDPSRDLFGCGAPFSRLGQSGRGAHGHCSAESLYVSRPAKPRPYGATRAYAHPRATWYRAYVGARRGTASTRARRGTAMQCRSSFIIMRQFHHHAAVSSACISEVSHTIKAIWRAIRRRISKKFLS